MASTTIDNETELSAVNAILGAIGQSPVTSLGNTSSTTTTSGGTTVTTNSYENPEVAFVYNLLKESNIDVQNEGWVFNREYHVTFTPNATTKHITIPDNILRIDVKNGWSDKRSDVVKRNGRLYDKVTHSDEFTAATVDCDVVYLFKFEDLPSVFKRYITAKASTRAATQLVANAELTKLLSQQEALTRASVMEYECNQGNHSMLGLPEGYTYDTYQPYRTLVR
jgi:hypothetical protein